MCDSRGNFLRRLRESTKFLSLYPELEPRTSQIQDKEPFRHTDLQRIRQDCGPVVLYVKSRQICGMTGIEALSTVSAVLCSFWKVNLRLCLSTTLCKFVCVQDTVIKTSCILAISGIRIGGAVSQPFGCTPKTV